MSDDSWSYSFADCFALFDFGGILFPYFFSGMHELYDVSARNQTDVKKSESLI